MLVVFSVELAKMYASALRICTFILEETSAVTVFVDNGAADFDNSDRNR